MIHMNKGDQPHEYLTEEEFAKRFPDLVKKPNDTPRTKAIRLKRKTLELSLRKLSELTGNLLDPATLSQFENGLLHLEEDQIMLIESALDFTSKSSTITSEGNKNKTSENLFLFPKDSFRKTLKMFLSFLSQANIELFDIKSEEPKSLCVIKEEEIDIRLELFFEQESEYVDTTEPGKHTKLSLTPRTDERTMFVRDVAPDEAVVFACFAGQLEREVAGLKWELLNYRNKLNAAQAEIDQLKAELRENANSCSQTNLEIEWCRSCTSKRWCVNGMKLLEESDGEQKTSKTPRTDKMNTLLLGRPLREAYEEMTEFSRDIERQRDEALNTSAARARIINKQTLDLAGMRTEIERLNKECAGCFNKKRDELIRQMRNALELISEGAIHGFHYVCQNRNSCLCLACQKKRVEAALAAEKSGR